MGLPRIERPRFPITIPSTGQKTFFVPFSVKEEKILLIAQESQDLDQIILAIKQILENCVEGFDSKNQPMFDLEYCLLKVRSKSVGELIPFEIEDPDTNEKVQLEFDVEKVQRIIAGLYSEKFEYLFEKIRAFCAHAAERWLFITR